MIYKYYSKNIYLSFTWYTNKCTASLVHAAQKHIVVSQKTLWEPFTFLIDLYNIFKVGYFESVFFSVGHRNAHFNSLFSELHPSIALRRTGCDICDASAISDRQEVLEAMASNKYRPHTYTDSNRIRLVIATAAKAWICCRKSKWRSETKRNLINHYFFFWFVWMADLS